MKMPPSEAGAEADEYKELSVQEEEAREKLDGPACVEGSANVEGRIGSVAEETSSTAEVTIGRVLDAVEVTSKTEVAIGSEAEGGAETASTADVIIAEGAAVSEAATLVATAGRVRHRLGSGKSRMVVTTLGLAPRVL